MAMMYSLPDTVIMVFPTLPLVMKGLVCNGYLRLPHLFWDVTTFGSLRGTLYPYIDKYLILQ
jgi:hypothetical protein